MTFRKFQARAAAELQAGHSVLLHAPTGLGKTWATAKGFVDNLPDDAGEPVANPLLGTRLLHVLPMRALANSVRKDIRSLLVHAGKEQLPAHWADMPDAEADKLARYKPTIHHGQQPESEIFAERIGVTTIDQYLAGFAGSPLSFASKSGHAVAGAIIASYSVFDEVHLLGPERGLPLLYAILQQRRRWGLLSAVMTATLPTSVRDYLCEHVGLAPIELSGEDIEQRDAWREVTLEYRPKPLASEAVAAKILEAQRAQDKVIAFANTVEAALELYRDLKTKQPTCPLYLIHSNFAPSHRQEREQDLLRAFGRDSQEEAILVTTQVAEAGLNISAPVVFSELAPVDSLIQRAGRCARFPPKKKGEEVAGQFIVYKPSREKSHVPYTEDLVERTAVAFDNRGGTFGLEWQAEQVLVDEVLDSFYAHYIRGEGVSRKEAEIKKAKKGQPTELKNPPPKTKAITTSDALGLLDQTFHSRDPRTLETTLRDINNVQIVVVSERPTNAAGAMFAGDDRVFGRSGFERFLAEQNKLWPSQRDTLESIPVSYGRFNRNLEERELWELEVTRVEHAAPTLCLTKHSGRVLPNQSYVMLQGEAGYSPEMGLTFAPSGYAEAVHGIVTPVRARAGGEDAKREHHFQTWLCHCAKVYEKADAMLNIYYGPWLLRLAEKMQERGVLEDAGDFAAKLESMIRLAALFHDIGKLNKLWQERIGWKEGPFWGKSQDNKVTNLPPHAFYALPALRYLFKRLGVVNDQGKVDRLADLMALASARHHSLGPLDGAMSWAAFEVQPGIIVAVHELLEQTLGEDAADLKLLVTDELFAHLNDETEYHGLAYPLDTPSPSEDYYPFYVLASRIIKVSDWEASGQREVELCR